MNFPASHWAVLPLIVAAYFPGFSREVQNVLYAKDRVRGGDIYPAYRFVPSSQIPVQVRREMREGGKNDLGYSRKTTEEVRM